MTLKTVEVWIDALAAVWDIDDGKGGTVRSFRMYEKNEYPAAITPTMAPCALSYPTNMDLQYSQGGPTILLWYGQTDFHLTEDCKPANIPYILPFYGRIILAAAAHMTLGGLVPKGFSILQNAESAIQFVTYKDAQGHDDHQGIIVKWTVEQNLSGQVPVLQ